MQGRGKKRAKKKDNHCSGCPDLTDCVSRYQLKTL